MPACCPETSFSGCERPIASSGELAALVTMASPGLRLEFLVWRDGRALRLSAVLDEPGKFGRGPVASAPPEPAPGQLGLVLRALEPVERRMMGLAAGLLVGFASGPARAAGVPPGDVMLAINGKPVGAVEQVRDILADAEKSVALLILRDGDKLFVPVRLP